LHLSKRGGQRGQRDVALSTLSPERHVHKASLGLFVSLPSCLRIDSLP